MTLSPLGKPQKEEEITHNRGYLGDREYGIPKARTEKFAKKVLMDSEES